jgi:uncharacterized protein DUF6916
VSATLEDRIRKKGLADFTGATLLPYAGQVFVFQRPAGPDGRPGGEARLVLLEVNQYPRQPGLSRDPFSLLFVMKGQAPLEKGLPRLMHQDFEPFDIFLQRVTVPKYENIDPAGMYYEAVFN